MTAQNLQALNLPAGGTVSLETSSLPGGVLALSAFVPPLRHVALTSAKTDTGVGLTATAAAGAMGVSRTAGTSLFLAGETTSTSAVTDKAMWETDLPDTYIAGAAVPVVANFSISGSGTLTAASCTAILHAYSEINGVEAALTVTPSAGVQITAAGADINWSVAGTGLTIGERIVLELTMLITTSSGANTGHVNKVAFSA